MTKGRHLWGKVGVLGSFLVLAGIGLYFLPFGSSQDTQSKTNARDTRALILRYELKNRSGRLQKDLYFWVRGAVHRSASGHLLKTESNRTYHEQTDHLGNRILTFPIEQIPPYGSIIVENKAYLAMDDVQVTEQDSPSALASALQPAPLIESTAPRIEKLARSFRQPDDTQRARAIYDWVVANIQVTTYRSRPLGALKTLQARKGDCTEFAHLYAALARATGLPARVMAGYRHQGSALMRPDDLHNWVEVYLQGRWRIADAHARHFLSNEDEYIAVLRLDMRGKGELQGHQRYKVSNPAIEVRQF